MIERILQQIEDRKTSAMRREDYLVEHRSEIENLLLVFKAADIDILDAEVCSNCVDFEFTGDFQLFKNIFKALRRAGWEPDDRPTEEKFTSWNGFFSRNILLDSEPSTERKFPRIWINFASTSCKLVKTGTRTIEQNIYEVECA